MVNDPRSIQKSLWEVTKCNDQFFIIEKQILAVWNLWTEDSKTHMDEQNILTNANQTKHFKSLILYTVNQKQPQQYKKTEVMWNICGFECQDNPVHRFLFLCLAENIFSFFFWKVPFLNTEILRTSRINSKVACPLVTKSAKTKNTKKGNIIKINSEILHLDDYSEFYDTVLSN